MEVWKLTVIQPGEFYENKMSFKFEDFMQMIAIGQALVKAGNKTKFKVELIEAEKAEEKPELVSEIEGQANIYDFVDAEEGDE